MENPIHKLLQLLQIPIERTVDFGNYVEIIFNDVNIGSVPATQTPGNRIFETGPEVLNLLRWDFIYRSEKESIDQAIASIFGVEREVLEITLGTFRRLYVRDKEGEMIGSVTCIFTDGQWNIYPEQQLK